MNDELKPCPRCGGEAELVEINLTIVSDLFKNYVYEVRCSRCGLFTDRFSRSETIAMWNRSKR